MSCCCRRPASASRPNHPDSCTSPSSSPADPQQAQPPLGGKGRGASPANTNTTAATTGTTDTERQQQQQQQEAAEGELLDAMAEGPRGEDFTAVKKGRAAAKVGWMGCWEVHVLGPGHLSNGAGCRALAPMELPCWRCMLACLR